MIRNKKGFALILTLVISALIVALTAELMHQVYVDTSISRNFTDGQQASILAESSIKFVARQLQDRVPNLKYISTYHIDRLINELKPFTKQNPLTEKNASIDISVVEEDGKINLNSLVSSNGGAIEPKTRKILMRLGSLIDHPVPDNAWDNLATWLDEKTPSTFSGADTSYYMTLKPPYKARKGKLKTINELSLVKGFTPQMVADLRKLVTIYSAPAPNYSVINLNTAPKKVLSALCPQISPSGIDRIEQEQRKGTFSTTGAFSVVPGLQECESEYPGMIKVKGGFDNNPTYKITTTVHVNDSFLTVEAILRIGSDGYLSWQEY